MAATMSLGSSDGASEYSDYEMDEGALEELQIGFYAVHTLHEAVARLHDKRQGGGPLPTSLDITCISETNFEGESAEELKELNLREAKQVLPVLLDLVAGGLEKIRICYNENEPFDDELAAIWVEFGMKCPHLRCIEMVGDPHLVERDGLGLGMVVFRPDMQLQTFRLLCCAASTGFFGAVRSTLEALSLKHRHLREITIDLLRGHDGDDQDETLGVIWGICAACPRLRTLKITQLYGCAPQVDPISRQVLPAVPLLQRLNLSNGCLFRLVTCEMLGNFFVALTSLEVLEELDLSGTELMSFSLPLITDYLKQQTPKNALRKLNLSSNKGMINQAGPIHAAEFAKAVANLPTLEELTLPLINKQPNFISHFFRMLTESETILKRLSLGVEAWSEDVNESGAYPPIETGWTNYIPSLPRSLYSLWIGLNINDPQWLQLLADLKRNRHLTSGWTRTHVTDEEVSMATAARIASVYRRNRLLLQLETRQRLPVSCRSQWAVLLAWAGNQNVFLDGTVLFFLLRFNGAQLMEQSIVMRKRGHSSLWSSRT